MWDGKKLKEILDSKGTNVRQIAKATDISATTLYSIIQKDSNIRFDFALRLANELEIDVNEICSASPFSGAITEEEIYPTLPNGLNGALDGNRVKTYLKNLLCRRSGESCPAVRKASKYPQKLKNRWCIKK